MARIKFLFTRSHILFLTSIAIGILLPQGVEIASILTLPALMVIMTITLLRFPRGFFRRPDPLLSGAIWGNIMSYLVLGNLIILASFFLILENGFWVGMILVAAVPPATIIIPMGNIFRVNRQFIFSGMAGAYLGAALIVPLIGLGFLKFSHMEYSSLILLIAEVILLPLLLSRLAVDKDWDKVIENYNEPITDGCFFIIFYALAAVASSITVQRPLDIVLMFVIAFVSTFLLGFIIKVIGIYYVVPKEKIYSLILLGTIKNYALAGAIALNIFYKQAAVPALIFSVVMFIYTLWLKYTMGSDIASETNIKSS